MSRLITPLAVALAIASAFLLYIVSLDTRTVEAHLQARDREIEKLRSDIRLLQAERALLTRPERIEPLARAQGLAPPSAQQIRTLPGAVSARSATGSVARASGAGDVPQP